jgi:hypothetical protein
MKPIFLAFAFRDNDRELANQVQQLLASHDVRVVTGERLGGEALTEAVKESINQSDGLIALLTQRDKIGKKGYTTHQWVQDELTHARANSKRAIALIETGVNVAGMYAANEYIPFDRQNSLPAFLALSDTIGQWKREVGRIIKVRILPPNLARKVGQGTETIKCRYRFQIEGRYTEWKESNPVPEPGGTFIYLEGVRDDHTIQIEVDEQKSKWLSVASPQWVQIQLSRRGADK